jgi:hypothetical protein
MKGMTLPHQNYINHVGLVLDASGSMGHLQSSTVKVADLQVQYLAQRSQELDQETRATVYQFDTRVDCLYYDKDVLRLPSIANHYKIGGQTALIDASLQAMKDLQQTATLYGDHAFLLYVLTDGMENASKAPASSLRSMLTTMPDNWTIAVFVPDQNGVFEAKKLGFAPGNIQVWDTSAKGIQEVGRIIQSTTDAYMQARSQGVRSTKGLFQLGIQNLDQHTVETSLTAVPSSWYTIVLVPRQMEISEGVETLTGQRYQKGSAFYQLTKAETIQASKDVFVRDRATRVLFSGRQARTLLGLPDYDVRVAPADHPNYDIFIQSTSYNRKLVPGTELIVLK